MDYDYEDWQPPSEVDMKVMQARRERSDRISKLMGDYLLKGYKMLGTTCRDCDTILLQTKQGVNYCIACSELDSDADKDDPATNQAAALALERERETREREMTLASGRQAASPPPSPPPSPLASPRSHIASSTNPAPRPTLEVTSTSTPASSQSRNMDAARNLSLSSGGTGDAAGVVAKRKTEVVGKLAGGEMGVRVGSGEPYFGALLEKMNWASGELSSTRSVEYSIQLCHLIKSAAEAVAAVRGALDS